MLTLPTILALGLSILATSFLSGIFGMAGGLLLLAICLALLDLAPAMMLHAATQFTSNGWRAAIWQGYIIWPVIWRYTIATVIVFAVMRYIAFLPDKAVVYILLGLSPFVAEMLPARWSPDIQRPGAPYLCGVLSALMQILAGVGGTVADIFFQASKLDRRQIIATKATTQAIGHLLRVLYFGSFALAPADTLPLWAFAGAIVMAILGTTLSSRVLDRMTDSTFRQWSRLIIRALGISLIARGVWLLGMGA